MYTQTDKLFVILRKTFRSSKIKKDSINGMTVDEVLLSSNTVFAIGNTGNWKLTAITKDVREMFTVFGLEPQRSGQVILG